MKQALIGYTYQHRVTSLLLSLMDTKRMITCLEIEVDADHKFDDLNIIVNNDAYYFQIKDFQAVTLEDIVVSSGNVSIQGKPHPLSSGTNIIFFKDIDLAPDSEILGFSSKLLDGIHIVSLNRTEIDNIIDDLYKTDHWRRNIIDQFLDDRLDKRQFRIAQKDLPTISFYSTKLLEPTVDVARSILEYDKILFLEGKPGIGKSHLVNHLKKTIRNTIVYRFWTSNQDIHKNERLRFDNFLMDISKRLFSDYLSRSQEEIILQLEKLNPTIIIDGLDHVENYNKKDLQRFIDFFDLLTETNQVIVLSRPLQHKIEWKRQLLNNWNFNQTRQVLKELYHIDEYDKANKIYSITAGYPILVRYIAEHFKRFSVIQDFNEFSDINAYYDEIFENEKGKQAIALFICSTGYFMKSEIEMFLPPESAAIVLEFVEERPYLFDIRINRITLFHDSLLTYLRNRNVNYASISQKVGLLVYNSIIAGDKRFQSRVIHFDLSPLQIKSILEKYASMGCFKVQMENTIDYEAVREFYGHLRELMMKLDPGDLDLIHYYDLALILCLVVRDHTSTFNGFNYIYLRTLFRNGFSEEDITSSRYLFGMLYFYRTNDGSYLENLKSDDMYDTSRFYQELNNEISDQQNFFSNYTNPLPKKQVDHLIGGKQNYKFVENCSYVLADLYVNTAQRKHFRDLYDSVRAMMDGDEVTATVKLLPEVLKSGHRDFYATWILKGARTRLFAMGESPDANDYMRLTLKAYLNKNRHKGSFEIWSEILDYMRLSLYQDRPIDIASISFFWTKYYQRHDYTLLEIPLALIVFEKKGYISWQNSVRLIMKIQDLSEKGYRWLLGSYIEEKGTSFLGELLNAFNYQNLKITWFHLKPEFLDELPQEAFYYELGEQMSYHAYNKTIDSDDIINAIKSDKQWLVLRDFNLANFKIRIKNSNHDIQLLKDMGFDLEIYQPDQYESEDNQIDQVEELSMSIPQISRSAGKNYAALSEPEKFKKFPNHTIRENIKEIFFNGLTAKTKNFDSFNNTFSLPGSMIKIVADADVEYDFKLLFDSFKNFLELSHQDI